MDWVFLKEKWVEVLAVELKKNNMGFSGSERVFEKEKFVGVGWSEI